MDRRKRILVNNYEAVTHAVLEEAASKHWARVYPKVRVADALEIEFSQLTREEYSYALKAHFDFVVAREGEAVAFAVEFDGPEHDQDTEVILRDELKNSICDRLGMPLLRIDAGYLRRVGRFSLLGWLVEVWFLYKDFCAAQERGEIPYNEDWDYSMYLGRTQGGRFIWETYDPFLPSRSVIAKCYDEGVCLGSPEIPFANDPQGYSVALALLKVADGRTIIGVARCRCFKFPPVEVWQLSRELARVDAAEKLRRYRRGQYQPSTIDEVNSWRKRMAQWAAHTG